MERGNPKARGVAVRVCVEGRGLPPNDRGGLLLGVERACDLIVEQLFGLDDAP